MTEQLVLDGLIAATAVGTAIVISARAVTTWKAGWSGHVRHALVLGALLAPLATFVLHLALKPVPLRCLVSSCLTTPEGAAQSQGHYTWSAAGKFPDLQSTGDVALTANALTPFATLILTLWILGALVVGAGGVRRRLVARGLVQGAKAVTEPALLARVTALATQLGVRRRVRLASHPAIAVPSVAGIVRPTILLPSAFGQVPAEFRDMVLVHELAHVRRRDILASAVAELAVVVFWFNPFVRRASATIGELQEMAADSVVLQNGARASSYAQFLVDTFRDVSSRLAMPTPGHALVGECQVETRVKAILDQRRSHHAPSIVLSLVASMSFVSVAGAFTFAPSVLHAFNLDGASRRQVALERRLLNANALDSIIRPVVINRMADRYVAGAAVAVVHEGRVVYQQGFGRREVFHELPVEAGKTIWRIGSITKVLTGVAVMQLVDRGLLDLDADVNQYLKDFKVASTYTEPVRVRHLLTHTAGFDQIGLGRQAGRAESVRPLGDFLKPNLVRIRPPGVVTTYDTYAITLAGYLVEQVSGLTYDEYLRRNIFTPLGMHRSGITIPPALATDLAVGYGFAGSWEAERWEYMNTEPASSVNATVTDMARFATMLLEGGRFEGSQVLSAASVRGMLSQQFTNHPEQPGYGLTFFEDRSFGVPGFSHGGSMTGYGAFLFLIPEHRVGIFVATNQESGAIAYPLVTKLVDALFPGHGPATPPRSRLADGDLSRFFGTYANSMHHHSNPATGWRRQPFDLASDSAGHLVFDGKPAFRVGPLSFQRDDGVLLSFREDARGQITHFFVNQTVFERLR